MESGFSTVCGHELDSKNSAEINVVIIVLLTIIIQKSVTEHVF